MDKEDDLDAAFCCTMIIRYNFAEFVLCWSVRMLYET